MDRTDIIALVLVLFAFRGEIMEYGGPILERFVEVDAVVQIDEPEQENLDLIKSTKIDDFDYTKHDKLMLAIFHNQLAGDIDSISVDSVSIQDLLDHHIDTLNNYVKSNKIERKYDGLSKSINDIFVDTLEISLDMPKKMKLNNMLIDAEQ